MLELLWVNSQGPTLHSPGGTSDGSNSHAGSRSSTLARVRDMSSPSNAFLPVNISNKTANGAGAPLADEGGHVIVAEAVTNV